MARAKAIPLPVAAHIYNRLREWLRDNDDDGFVEYKAGNDDVIAAEATNMQDRTKVVPITIQMVAAIREEHFGKLRPPPASTRDERVRVLQHNCDLMFERVTVLERQMREVLTTIGNLAPQNRIKRTWKKGG